MVVIEDAWSDSLNLDTGKWEPRKVASAGDVVFIFTGVTYGCIAFDGVACSHGGERVHPFFEVHRSNLAPPSA